MAAKYAGPSADYYMDRITLELEKYQQDSDRKHFSTALKMIDESLKTLKPRPGKLLTAILMRRRFICSWKMLTGQSPA